MHEFDVNNISWVVILLDAACAIHAQCAYRIWNVVRFWRCWIYSNCYESILKLLKHIFFKILVKRFTEKLAVIPSFFYSVFSYFNRRFMMTLNSRAAVTKLLRLWDVQGVEAHWCIKKFSPKINRPWVWAHV